MRTLSRFLAISAITLLGAVTSYSAPTPIDTSGPMVTSSVITSEGSCFAKGAFVAQGELGLLGAGNIGAYYGVVGGSVNADYGVHDLISVGAGLGFTATRNSTAGTVTYMRYLEFPMGVRAAFHPLNFRKIKDKVKITDKLDLYVGAVVGGGVAADIWIDPTKTFPEPAPQYGFFLARPIIGARYYFIPNKLFGTFELGGVCGWFNFGAGMKF